MPLTPSRAPSLLGGALIIAGTVVGAGMFANPTATAGIWFGGSLLVLAYTWFCMLASGLMLLEVGSHYPAGASFDTLVKDLLGPVWNGITGLAVAFVLYVLTYAYIFVGGDLTAQNLSAIGQTVPLPVGQLLFFAVLALCVVWSSRWVGRLTSVLLGEDVTVREAFRVVKPGGKIVFVDYHKPSRLHPLYPVMHLVLKTLEPYALDLWKREITDWFPAEFKAASISKKTYFGGLYQIIEVVRA